MEQTLEKEPQKDAIVYVIDLGSSMGECHNGRVQSDLEYGMQYIWDKLGQILQENKKQTLVGVIGFRTDETDNPLSEDSDYDNMCVLKPMGRLEMNQLEGLRTKIQPSETEAGDAVSAIVLAIHMIGEATLLKSGKPGKYGRKIYLLTNGHGSIEDDAIDSIAAQINHRDNNIRLTVVGIDFDDPEYGFKEEDKSETKENTESLLRRLVDNCKNEPVFGTAAAAIENLSEPTVKKSKFYKKYDGKLSLGDFEKYPRTAVSIDVQRFFKTKAAKPPSATSYITPALVDETSKYSTTLQDDTEMTDAPSSGLVAVKSSTNYTVDDPEAPGGKKNLYREDLAKGYAYGRTAVYLSESEQNIATLETSKSFSIIGFIPSDGYAKYLSMGDSCVTIAQPTDERSRLAFSSLVHALQELDSYAVARIVMDTNKKPQILLLAPWFGENLDREALVDVPLPFAEDVRIYKFPPLDRVITSSGASLSKHRFLLPSEELEEAMSDYIDKMDLSTFGKDDEGEPAEYMKVEDTFTPTVHRINQAIRQRAMHPGEPIGPPAEVLTKWSNPPIELVENAKRELQKVKEIADIKTVPPKAKSKRGRSKETVKPLSGLDVEEILNQDKTSKISQENAIPDFKQMIRRSSENSGVEDATKQMGKIIRNMITDTTGHQGYDQALAYMRVFRNEMIEYEFPQYYNDFLQDLKDKIINSQLGDDDKTDFWYDSFRGSKLGLIDQEAVDISEVTEEEAGAFMRLNSTALSTCRK